MLSDFPIEFYQKFGQLVRERRQQRKISQEGLAEVLRVSRGTIVNMENGKFAVQFHLALRAMGHLNISVMDFLMKL